MVKYIFYQYDPTLIGAIIFSAAFFITSFLHAYQLIRTRTWYFIPMLIGGLMEAIGYIGRIQSHYDKQAMGPYLQQALLLLVAPALYAASIYMVLGRLISTIGAEHHSLIPIRWLTKVFVFGDVLSFMLQAAGGGMMSGNTASMRNLGQKNIIAGLFAQIIFFSVFLSVAVVFNRRISKSPTVLGDSLPTTGRKGWLTLLRVLYSASILILVRSVFRVVEYVQGHEGYLMRNEVWLYIFDSVLMLAVPVLFNIVHPSGAVPGRRSRRGGSIETMLSGEVKMTDMAGRV